MADAKHTRGPWMLRGTIITPADTDQVEIAEILTEEDETVFDAEGNLIGASRADGLLIAASPELLEALQHAVHWFDQLKPEDIARYRIAIAKATGSAA